MAPWDVTYTGLRTRQPEWGHGGPLVVGVTRNGERGNLELDDDRVVDGEFEWGYEGAGPRRLAVAILNDFLRQNVELAVSNAFVRDVVAHLPSEFELTGAEIAAWMSARSADAFA
ncbi:MAG TPA: DUF6166 domain-containing protein [Solirubrobacteraceae bacterium]|nr:DUF6166 domain-containing protein [Solirubrobacteraceae bacterium]